MGLCGRQIVAKAKFACLQISSGIALCICPGIRMVYTLERPALIVTYACLERP